MRFAYADPPYLGCCSLYGHRHDGGTVEGCWDDVETHWRLVNWLDNARFDGWALSCSSSSLWQVLPLCRYDVRIGAWVKPFAVFKPNVNPAYAWEPVIFRGGRKRSRDEATVRDWTSQAITLERGLVGAKPDGFCFWIFDLFGAKYDDEMVDVFPGTGAVSRAWESYRRQLRIGVVTESEAEQASLWEA